jgi:hypothetical protein
MLKYGDSNVVEPEHLKEPFIFDHIEEKWEELEDHILYIHVYTKFGSPMPATHASDGFCIGVSSKAEMMVFTHGELYSAP